MSLPQPSKPAPAAVEKTRRTTGTTGSKASSIILRLAILLLLCGTVFIVWRESQKRPKPVTPVGPVAPPQDAPPVPVVPDAPKVIPKPDATPTPVVKQDVEKPAPLKVLPALNHPDALAALQAATRERIKDGRWAEHTELVRAATLATLTGRRRSAGGAELDSLCERGALPLAMAQLTVLQRLGEEALLRRIKAESASEVASDFTARLLTTPAMLELLADNLAPEDNLATVLDRWAELDARENTPAGKETFRNLALALALIYDKANGETEAANRYAYYHKQFAANKLLIQPAKLEPDELVWAVGPGSFPLEDGDWAVKHLPLSLSNLGTAYFKVPYRMNHAPYPEYRMEHVLEMGGICMNQSQFAEGNARARGVPCAYVAGEGSRGGHAWFAVRGPKGWTNTTGRYHDGYACGMARNPQTGKPLREWDLLLFNDRGRTNGDRRAALRLSRAAEIVPDATEKLALLEAAARRQPGDPARATAWFKALLADNQTRPVDFWLKLVNDFRNEFKLNPDHFDITDRIETEKIFPRMEPDRVGEFLRNRRRQALRQNPDRFDKLTESVRREADYYKSIGDEKRIGTLYAGALREYGDNLPAFMRLAADFAELSQSNPDVRRAGMNVLESVYNKDVDTKLKGDTFALEMQSKVAARVAEIFAAEGDAKKAAKYRERAATIAAKSKELRAAMR